MTLRSFFGLVDLALSVQRKVGKALTWVRNRWSPDQTDPIPLSSRDIEHIQGQIRQATTVRSSSRYDEIIPPPPTANSRPGSKLTRL